KLSVTTPELLFLCSGQRRFYGAVVFLGLLSFLSMAIIISILIYCELVRNCSEGWKGFFCSCYFFSTQNKTQKESRQDCRDRGAELVIVNNIEEQALFLQQEFLTNNITADTWIGLSDQDNEGTWKWADDTPLTQGYWEADQPDDWRGEDCVQFGKGKKKEANWNDISCDESLRWICEK
uniref:C-type lectin domain-containing protein n=1 Tax=Labrus bergylta TaxID=56723 RepID=A0A3Q3MAS7_9LABR